MAEGTQEIGLNRRWDRKVKIFCTEKMIELKSPILVQRAFKKEFKAREAPGRKTLLRWVRQFRSLGTIETLNTSFGDGPTTSGRPRVRTEEVIAMVKESVEISPKRSLRRRSQCLDLKKDTLHRILTDDLDLFPYRIQVMQELTKAQMKKRLEMAIWFAEKIEDVNDWIKRVWFSDEAHFLLSGHVNSKNAVYWGLSKPDEVLQKPLHSVKCTAWVAMSATGIIGPFWFQDDRGKAQTVTTVRYLEVLEKFWADLPASGKRTAWFQQDGASCHCSKDSLEWLQERFNTRLISRRLDTFWSPHSPDLSPPDFFLWGYLKGKVYRNKPRTIPQLQRAVEEEIRAIPTSMCNDVISNFCKRISVCISRKGKHLEHVLK